MSNPNPSSTAIHTPMACVRHMPQCVSHQMRSDRRGWYGPVAESFIFLVLYVFNGHSLSQCKL